jgi:hypothetical protein
MQAQLLNVSLPSLDKMYHVQGKIRSDEEWGQAVASHNAMFEMNKHKGNYCDINADKILQDFPNVRSEVRTWLSQTFPIPATERKAVDIAPEPTVNTSANTSNAIFASLPFTHSHVAADVQADWFDQERELPKIVPKVPLPIFVLNIRKSGTKTIQQYFSCGMYERCGQMHVPKHAAGGTRS